MAELTSRAIAQARVTRRTSETLRLHSERLRHRSHLLQRDIAAERLRAAELREQAGTWPRWAAPGRDLTSVLISLD